MKNSYTIKGPVTEIIATHRKWGRFVILIDTEYLPLVQRYSWGILTNKDGTMPYAITKLHTPGKSPTNLRMNRLIFGLDKIPDGYVVDHENHNTLDNKRLNLRSVIECINQLNRSGAQSNSKSGLRGVSWAKHTKRWIGRVNILKKTIHVGYFDDPLEAYEAVQKYHQKHKELENTKPEDIVVPRKSTSQSRHEQSQKAAEARWAKYPEQRNKTKYTSTFR